MRNLERSNRSPKEKGVKPESLRSMTDGSCEIACKEDA